MTHTLSLSPNATLTEHSLLDEGLSQPELSMTPTHLKVFVVEAREQLLVVTPQGDTEAFRYQEVHVETNSLLDFVRRNQPQKLLVDFSAVPLIGSLMFASLIKLARFFDSDEKMACFCCASDPMQQSMQAMRLTSHWPHFESREAALVYLGATL